MPLYWLVYRHNNSTFVVIEPVAPYEIALILEYSTDARIITTDTINANVAATAPIDLNGFFSISRAHRSELTSFSLRRRPRVTNKARHVKPHPKRGGKARPEENKK